MLDNVGVIIVVYSFETRVLLPEACPGGVGTNFARERVLGHVVS